MNPAFYTFWGNVLEVSENVRSGAVHLAVRAHGNLLYDIAQYPSAIRAIHDDGGVTIRDCNERTPHHLPLQLMDVRTHEMVDTVQVLRWRGIKSKHVRQVVAQVAHVAGDIDAQAVHA